MEGPYIQTSVENGVMTEQEWGKSREQEEDNTSEASPLAGFTGEETDEDSEPEPPLVIRRKVSFADAFGLNLVSVKEFDNVDVPEPEDTTASEQEVTHPLVEFYMSCLFTVPSSGEELDERLQVQNLELESIELLPTTTTLRGIIRVVNLCYSKSVYVRISLDRWQSYFELLAQYVPGSSDRKTDRFSFSYPLSPPFEKEGTRVEFCLRYETSVGTFWANNKEMNYVLFCHHKGQVKEPQMQDESPIHKGKRSCLKANRRGSTEEKTRDSVNTAAVATETKATCKAEEADRKTVDITDLHSLIHNEQHKPLVDIIRNRHRARTACMKEKLSQRRQQVQYETANGLRQRQRFHQQLFKPVPHPWGDSTSVLRKHPKKRTGESPQVLTYHQIPLLTLDWNKPQGPEGMEDIWTGGATTTLPQPKNTENEPSVSDIWETFLNSTDNNADEAPVCDVWQAFLNRPSYEDHSGVPESEWLQTAASVSPSNDKITRHVARSRERISHVDKNTPEPSLENVSASCQPLSHAYESSLATVCDTCVSTSRDDSALTQHAPQRSQTNSITDTFKESGLLGPGYVSEGSVDSSSQWHKHAIWGRERGELTARAGGIGGDQPITPPTADSVTSSGESETTDMTAVSQNASAVDRISQGARLREVTGTAHNAADDTLAFRETIRQTTKHGEGFAFTALRQGAEEGITPNGAEWMQKSEESEASRRYADENQHEKPRLQRYSKNPKMPSERNQSADEFKLNPTSESKNKQSQILLSKFKSDESENEHVASNTKEVLRKTDVELSCCATKEEAGWSGAEVENIQILDEEAWQHNENGLEVNSLVWQKGKPSVLSKEHNKEATPIPAGEEQCILKGKREAESTPVQRAEKDQPKSQNILNQTEKETDLSDLLRPFSKDKCQPKILEMTEVRWTHQKEDEGGKTSTEKANMALKYASTESEILKTTDEDAITRKQKIEAVEELMGNVANPQDKSKNVAPDVKGQEFTAVGSSPCVEGRKLSGTPKDPITAENSDLNVSLRPFSKDKCQPKILEMAEVRWTHQKEDEGGKTSTEKESMALKYASTESEILKTRDEDASTKKQKIEAVEELMGKVMNPQDKSKNVAPDVERQEFTAVENSPCAEGRKLSETPKDPITAENSDLKVSLRPFSKDKCQPKILEMAEVIWTHQKEDEGGKTSTEKESMALDYASTESEIPKMIEDDESTKKQQLEAVEELMGNVENPQDKSKNVAPDVKGQEFTAVGSSPCVEGRKLSRTPKDPITAENSDLNVFLRPYSKDKCQPKILGMAEVRWTHQKEDEGGKTSTEKESMALDYASTESEIPKTIDEDASTRKQRIEALEELMGKVVNPQDKSNNVAPDVERQEFTAVENSSCAEGRKLSETPKDPITAENSDLKVSLRPFSKDKCQPKILEMAEVRWTHQKKDEGGKTSTEKESMALKYASTESEIPKTIDEDVSTRKQRIEALDELMGKDNKSKHVARQDFTAVESSLCVEGIKLSKVPKSPITAENAAVLGVGLDKMFAEHLVRGIWEEVLGWKTPVCNTVDEIVDNEGFDSGLRLRNVCLSQGREHRPRADEHTPTGESQSYNKTEPASNSSAPLSQAASPVLSGKSCPACVRDSQTPGSQKDRENSTRSVACLETARLSVQQSLSSEKPNEADGLIWWSLLYVLSHLTSLLLCILLVVGFFVKIFLYDFPAFFALYVFSLCWWFCKWKRHRVTADKETAG